MVTAPSPSSFTDKEAWSILDQASDVVDAIDAWLRLQCAQLPAVRAGAVVVEAEDGARLAAWWPKGEEADSLAEPLAAARQRLRGVLSEDRVEVGVFRIAFPVIVAGAAIGSAAVEVGPLSSDRVQTAMRALQWGVAGLRERFVAERLAALSGRESIERGVLESIAAALEPEGLRPSARAVATDLAHRLGCERVGVGIVRKERCEVVAISHSASFGQDMNLVRLVAEAMDEAIDQQSAIVHPPPRGDRRASRAHKALAAAQGSGRILTVPLFVREHFVGALTLERALDQPFTADELAQVDVLSSALAPIFEEKRANDRPLWEKALEAGRTQVDRLFGPRHGLYKVVALGAVVFALVFTVWKDTWRVTADAVVEGREQRAIVVAFNGFLREAPARAGDLVKAGDLLAALDDRDLVLERLKWSTERQRRSFEYEKALGEHNRTDLRIFANQIEQADAQIKLVDEQLARARMVAPFDGVVVSGDHSQAIGASVQRGQMLFEVAPADGHRVMLDVDESEIADVATGQGGRLVLAALPTESFPVEVVRLTPVAKAQEGRNLFRVEARPTGPTPQLRPGMRGAAKIDIDRRRVLWIWTHGLTNWLKLTFWRWGA